MAPSEFTPTVTPAPTLDEIGSRFLGLVSEFRADAMISVDRVEALMNVHLEHTDRGNLEASGIAGGNTFTVAYDQQAGVGLYFMDKNLAPICPLSIAPLLHALPHLDASMPYVLSNGSRAGWYYVKDDGAFVEIGVNVTAAENPIERDLVCQISVRPAK